MEVVSVGKRLRRIRKQFGIRQDEIVGDLVTRNMISIIENDKASLTPKVAQIVAEHINQICVDRGFNFNITVEELLESEEEQVRKIAVILAEEIALDTFNLNDEKKKAEVLEIENRLVMKEDYKLAFDLDMVCEDYFAQKNQYFEAYYYCKRAVDLSSHLFGHPESFRAYSNISYNLICLEHYKEALYYCNLTLEKFKNLEPKQRYIIMMNKNIAAGKLGDIPLSKITIDDMLHIENLPDLDRNKVWISKANRLAEEKKWVSALEIYNEIYPNLEYTPQKYLVLSNLIDIYIDIGNEKELNNTMKKALDSIERDLDSVKSSYLGKIYFKLAKGALVLNQDEDMLAYSDLALDYCYNKKDYNELKVILEFKISYSCERNQKEAIKELVATTQKWVKERIVKRDDDCVWRFMNYLTDLKDMKSLKKLLDSFNELN